MSLFDLSVVLIKNSSSITTIQLYHKTTEISKINAFFFIWSITYILGGYL